MAIHKATFAHPVTKQQMTMHSSLDLPKFRAVLADCQKAGYTLVEKTEDMTDFRSSEGVLMVLRCFMPMG